MSTCSKTKPTEPGRYAVRWQSDHRERYEVLVERIGRGLRVTVQDFHCTQGPASEAMSSIGDNEFEWRRRN